MKIFTGKQNDSLLRTLACGQESRWYEHLLRYVKMTFWCFPFFFFFWESFSLPGSSRRWRNFERCAWRSKSRVENGFSSRLDEVYISDQREKERRLVEKMLVPHQVGPGSALRCAWDPQVAPLELLTHWCSYKRSPTPKWAQAPLNFKESFSRKEKQRPFGFGNTSWETNSKKLTNPLPWMMICVL